MLDYNGKTCSGKADNVLSLGRGLLSSAVKYTALHEEFYLLKFNEHGVKLIQRRIKICKIYEQNY